MKPITSLPVPTIAALTLFAISSSDLPAKDTKKSNQYEAVVRIENSSLNPDYRTPWNSGRDSGGNGTGWKWLRTPPASSLSRAMGRSHPRAPP